MTSPLSILVVGGGMYVTGRGAQGSRGTILPALFEARRRAIVGKIAVSTTNAKSAVEVARVARDLGHEMGVNGDVEAFPQDGADGDAFLRAADADRYDAAIVSVPDDLHATVSIPLIERGMHCLVVKPLAGSRDDAERMAVAAKAAGVVAQVEFHKRLDESNLLMRDAIATKKIGSPLYAVIEYSQRKTIPEVVFAAWAPRSNIFQYLGVHYVDLLMWATGYVPKRVSAWGQKTYLAAKGIDTWDSMQVLIEWEGGDAAFVSTHITNWIDPDTSSAMSDQKINIVGTAGRFQADQKTRGVQIVTDASGIEDVNPYFTVAHSENGSKRFSGYGIASVNRFIDDVADVVAGKVTVENLPDDRPTFAQGYISSAVLDAALQSLASGNVPVNVRLLEQV